SGATMRRCCPRMVVWMPLTSGRPLQPRAAQAQPEQSEERCREEEAAVPLVVMSGAAGFVDLALLQRVEHRVQAALERFLVGGGIVRAAGHLGDLLQQLRVHVDLDRLVGGAAEEIGAGRVGDAPALADEDGEYFDAQL